MDALAGSRSGGRALHSIGRKRRRRTWRGQHGIGLGAGWPLAQRVTYEYAAAAGLRRWELEVVGCGRDGTDPSGNGRHPIPKGADCFGLLVWETVLLRRLLGVVVGEVVAADLTHGECRTGARALGRESGLIAVRRHPRDRPLLDGGEEGGKGSAEEPLRRTGPRGAAAKA